MEDDKAEGLDLILAKLMEHFSATDSPRTRVEGFSLDSRSGFDERFVLLFHKPRSVSVVIIWKLVMQGN